MCWSYEVTLAASVVETLSVLILCCRRQRNDCANARIILPFVLQEWLQVLLWLHMGASAYDCDEVNRVASVVVTYLVCAVPAWLSLQPFLINQPILKENRLLLLGGTLFGVGGCLVHFVAGNAGWMGGSCTYQGPWHHQVWPVMNMFYDFAPGWLGHAIGHVLSLANFAAYAAGSAGLWITTVPSYLLGALLVVGVQGELLILVLGPEWGSFWCFQASLLVTIAFVEPVLVQYLGAPSFLVPRGLAAGDSAEASQRTAEAKERRSQDHAVLPPTVVGTRAGSASEEVDALL